MKILVTGFEPFNQSDINPSMEIIGQLKAPKRTTLITEILPVEFKRSSERIKELLQIHRPEVVISLGQAGNRAEIAVERVAINLDNVRSSNGKSMLPDNAGDIRVDEPIEIDGAPAYFSTLPIWSLVNAINQKNIPAVVSNTAGTYVCNHVMYTVLYEAAKHYPEMRAGFVHVPFLPSQLDERKDFSAQPRYGMLLSDMVTGIQTVIDFMAP
ncbi:MAG: pyroglutamyl-peptidase I [Lachnospiraceae bacterium]|nr:pyroglutamyl-peptidase I [Lachnospiraceae bacterium]